MNDTKHADGRTSHLLKLTKDVKPIGIALDSIVDYDLNSFRLKIRENFSLDTILATNKTTNDSNVAKLAAFAAELAEYINLGSSSVLLTEFVEQLAEFFSRKDRADRLFEPEQLLAANDELKLSLLKASLIFDLKLSAIDK